MHILLFNYELPPVGAGGGRICWETCRELAKMGHDVTVVTARFRDLPHEETRDGVDIVRIPTLRKSTVECSVPEMMSYILSSCWLARSLARKTRPDVVHVYFGIPSGPPAWLLKKLRGLPYVVSLMGSDVPRAEVRKFRYIYPVMKPVLRSIWRNAFAVVANSEGLKEEALETAPDLDVGVIHNGIDTQRFQPGAGDAAGRENGPLELLTVGRLQEFKGLQYLLPAVKNILDGRPRSLHLAIVGDGPSRVELERLAADLGLGDAVRFVPWVDYAQMPDIYRNADAFLQPSLTEGMPNTVLEAMASGVAIVASDVAGNRDLVKDGRNGFLVEPMSADALTDAISRLVDDPAGVRRMGAESRTMAEAMTWRDVAAAYLDIYKRAAESRTQAAAD